LRAGDDDGSENEVNVSGAETLATLLLQRARTSGDRTFLVFEDASGNVIERTYAETYRRAERASGTFSSMGAAEGDVVHVHLSNCPEFFDCWFGAALMGAVVVPTNPLLTADELAFVLGHARARLTVTEPSLLDTLLDARSSRVLVARADGESLSRNGIQSFEAAMDAADTPPSGSVGPGPRDVAAIMYTSGTTDRPKGVCVTHANYLFVGEVVAQHLRMQPDDRMMIALPLFHANAQYYCTMSALVTGASIAVAERFSASSWSQQVARHSATLASLFAAPIRMILAQEPQAVDKQNRLRAVIFSQNVTEEQLAEFEDRFGCPLLQLYGMTETVAPPTLNPLYGDRRNMSIGRPTLPASLRIVGEDGRDVPTGVVGQLLVQGVSGVTLMAGYLDDPEATREALRDGWLHTGDNVRADKDGYLHFVDRGKDMIKRGGENISAGEVESVINDHPAVFDCAVIGVPDSMRDEAVKAFVVRAEGAQISDAELTEWCAVRLAKFKVPSAFEFVEALPRTSVGKIQKERLRQRATPLK
jgi:crotonobetaine/carnitine-CoA ligase